MSRLIIVAGAGGAGKSFFLRLWNMHDGKSVGIKKFVSDRRSPRESEIASGEADLIFASCYDPTTNEGKKFYQEKHPNVTMRQGLAFHNHKFTLASEPGSFSMSEPFTYNYHGTHYRVDIDSIDSALREGKTPIVIVRKSVTITNLLKRYSDALVIYVQSILSGEDLIKKLTELGESENDSKKRESRNKEDLDDYINNIHLLPSGIRVVLNDYSEASVLAQIEDIYKEEIENYTFRNKSVFVIQSYANARLSNENFNMIQQAARNCFGHNENVVRADHRDDGSYLISSHVFDSIDNSDCIVCDITNDRCDQCEQKIRYVGAEVEKKTIQGVSPNVWIELGYAIKSLSRRVDKVESRLIIIAKDNAETRRTQVPVDIGGSELKILTYASQVDLMTKVENTLRNMFKVQKER